MKNIFATIVTTFVILTSFSATAHEDSGLIKNVTPIYSEQNQQQQVCDQNQITNVQQTQQGNGVNGGTIIGGIAGALLGNQIGGGNGRVASTAVGAIVGAMSGDRIDGHNSRQGMQRQPSCRWIQTSVPQVSRYLVTYEYNGRTYQSTMTYDPSQGGTNSNIRVGVTVTAI